MTLTTTISLTEGSNDATATIAVTDSAGRRGTKVVTIPLYNVNTVGTGASHGLGANQTATTALRTAFDTWLGAPSAFVQIPFDQSSWSAYQSSISYLLGLYPSGTRAVWSVPMFGAGGSFADVTGGSKDSTVFTPLAQGILAKAPAGEIIVIRIGWEFNLSGQPWYAGGNVAAYIAAFKHIVDVFRAVSDRFIFNWCPNMGTISEAGFDIVTAYPGDAYVDIIGMDYYWNSSWDNMTDGTFGVSGFNYRKTVDRGLDWQVAFAAAHGKKLAMDEWAANHNYAKGWVGAMADYMASKGYLYHAWWNNGGAFNGTLSGNQYKDLSLAYLGKYGVPFKSFITPVPANLTLSNADQTGTATASGNKLVRVARPITGTERVYWEVLQGAANRALGVGVATLAATNSWMGDVGQAGCYSFNSAAPAANLGVNGAVFSQAPGLDYDAIGDRVMVMLDKGAKRLYLGVNGTWSVGNPANLTGGLDVSALGTGDLYAAIDFSTATVGTICSRDTDCTYPAPSGAVYLGA